MKPGPGGSVSVMLTPMQLLDRLAVLIPPPRSHRHRYLGVLAPNSPLRSAVTALAQPAGDVIVPAAADSSSSSAIAPPAVTTEEPAHRKAARYVWALLLARIYEVLPLLCPKCGGEMRIIAFITEAVAIREILGRLGEPTSPPRLKPARGPPLWEMSGAEPGETGWPRAIDPQAQPAPDYGGRSTRSVGPLPDMTLAVTSSISASPGRANYLRDTRCRQGQLVEHYQGEVFRMP